MRQILKTMLQVMALALALSSCATSIPAKMERYAAQTEKHCDSYGIDEWKSSIQEFQSLSSQYKENIDSYDAKQKAQANKATTKYYSLLATTAVGKGTEFISGLSQNGSKAVQQILGLISGAGSGIWDRIKGLFSGGGDILKSVTDAIQGLNLLDDEE